MESRKNQSSGGKYRKTRTGISGWTVALIVFGMILTTGGVLAKYVSSNRQRSEMESSQFHISSNYLEEGNSASYTVADWGSGFDILLFNYEKENIAQISGVEMTYQVTAINAAVSVKTQSGETVAENDGKFTFKTADTTVYHTLHVTPNDSVGAGKTITVTVKTTAPFQKTLKAEFKIQRNLQPDYTVTDREDGTILLTVKTNDYSDSMTVTWEPTKFSPDNTNVLMASWVDESHTGNFKAEQNSTYELLFFKNTNEIFKEQTGSGTEITLQ